MCLRSGDQRFELADLDFDRLCLALDDRSVVGNHLKDASDCGHVMKPRAQMLVLGWLDLGPELHLRAGLAPPDHEVAIKP